VFSGCTKVEDSRAERCELLNQAFDVVLANHGQPM
jgi:hypothetical protein